MNCLYCNKEIASNNEQLWHKKCIKEFFGTDTLPIIDVNFDKIEKTISSVDTKQDITGVQKKLSLHLAKDGKNARLTIVNKPAGYILKFESNSSDMAIDEYVTMTMAREIGIKTVPFGLIQLSNGNYAYITKRIDRIDDKKIHIEDFCQLSNKLTENKYSGSYEYCGKLIKTYSTLSMNNSTIELSEFFKLLLFCYLTGNSDMHLKNFSLIEDKSIYLSPAYDLINVYLLMNDEEDLALTLNGKKKNITKNDFIEFGLNIGLNEKQITLIINNVISNADKMMSIICNSLLSKEQKFKYLKEISNKRLKFIDTRKGKRIGIGKDLWQEISEKDFDNFDLDSIMKEQ